MKHVICILNRGGLTIERDGKEIGSVTQINGEPTLNLDSAFVTRFVQLTFNDIAIIQDNWNAWIELNGEIQTVVDKLPKGSKLAV